MSLTEKIKNRPGPLGQFRDFAHGYYSFPKLEGELGGRMQFNGAEVVCWSLNNYLGLANHPEVRLADEKAVKEFGMAYPMGARMMTGNTSYHEELEKSLAKFVSKADSVLLNYGFQGMLSAIESLVDRNDIIIYDAESHACIIDGARLHLGKRFTFRHNDVAHLEQQLLNANRLRSTTNGEVLVITEGVFGMNGSQGRLNEIVKLKEKYEFTLFVDDAHGVGVMGEDGSGTGAEQFIQDGIDIYFGTFAKAFASIGAFIGASEEIVNHLRYSMRSQIFAKSLPLPIVLGLITRLNLVQSGSDLRSNLWAITQRLQNGLTKLGLEIGPTNSPVTPVYLQGGHMEAAAMVRDLRENYGVFCSVVTYPVVPKGMIILRLIPTASHSIEDVDYTLEAFGAVSVKLSNHDYSELISLN